MCQSPSESKGNSKGKEKKNQDAGGGTSTPQDVDCQYDSVYVLLLHWQGDGQSYGPVGDLNNVFENSYHFNTSIFAIPSEDHLESVLGRIRQLEVDLKQKNTLLIVSYIGHGGMPIEKSFGVCAGGGDFPMWLYNPYFEWNKVQEELQKMDNDVLIIIDACNAAGAIATTDQSISKGRNELIAACPYNEKTPGGFWTPYGSTSASYQPCFISALTDALAQRFSQNEPPAFSAATLHLNITQLIIERCYKEKVRDPSGWLRQSVYYCLGRDLQKSSIALKVLKPKDDPEKDVKLKNKRAQEITQTLANLAKDPSKIDGKELQELFKELVDLKDDKQK